MAGNVDAGWTLLTVREEVQRFPSYLPCQCATSPPFTCSLSPKLTSHTGWQWEPWLCVVGMNCDGSHGRDREGYCSGSN